MAPGWKVVADGVTDRVPSNDALATALRAHYATPCSMRTAMSRLKKELRRRGLSTDRMHAPLNDIRNCKRAAGESVRRKNRSTLSLDGDALLARAEHVLLHTDDCDVYELILALMFVSGRRTTEIANGRSRFTAVPKEPHACRFRGQLKTKRKVAYTIPLLVPFSVFAMAMTTLRARQKRDVPTLSNARVSSRYQSALSQYAKKHPPWKSLNRVHDLRGAYAVAVYQVLDFEGHKEMPSQAEVVTRILGDHDITQSLVYTTFRVTMRRADVKLRWATFA